MGESRPHPLRMAVIALAAKVAKGFVCQSDMDVETLFPSNMMPILIRAFAGNSPDVSMDKVSLLSK